MKTALQIDITYDKILELVKQLPEQDKIKLTKELEKEGIESKLSELLNIFKTNKLSIETIHEEAEIVRQQLYEKKIISTLLLILTFGLAFSSENSFHLLKRLFLMGR